MAALLLSILSCVCCVLASTPKTDCYDANHAIIAIESIRVPSSLVENGHEGFISLTPTTTMDFWIRRVLFWNGLRKLGVEVMGAWTSD